MLTPLQELIEFIDGLFLSQEFTQQDTVRNALLQMVAEKAQSLLPKEKQNYKDAFNEGYREGETDNGYDKRDVSECDNADIYFNQTYKP